MDVSVKSVGTVSEVKALVDELYKMTIKVSDCRFSRPGQYAIVGIPGTDLEKVFTVCEFDSERFTVAFLRNNTVAEALVKLEPGDQVEVETGLGEGFDVDAIPDGAVIAADTAGIPPMLALIRALIMQGKRCSLVLGFSSKDKTFMMESFSKLCNNIEIVTADGSNGRQGHADDAVKNADYVCAAGTVEMLDRLTKKAKAGQFNVDGMNITAW